MGSPTSITAENPEPRRSGGSGPKGTPAATDYHDVGAAYSDECPPVVPGPVRSRRPGC